MGFGLGERDAGELVEEGGFGLVGNELAEGGVEFGFEAAVVLEQDGVETLGENMEVSGWFFGMTRICSGELTQEVVAGGFRTEWLI